MRPLLFLLAMLCFLSSSGRSTFNKLTDVNKCWLEQRDVNPDNLPGYSAISDTEWIRLHLRLVEQTLRAKNNNHLTTEQKQNRAKALDCLHEYWLRGAFPKNEDYSYLTPIFIDKYDNFCAVGYLVKATGYEHVSRMISAKTNVAYVREMNYPELDQWAKDYGFTTDELAWIQPSYAPIRNNATVPIGKGTSGTVYELSVDTTTQFLYVGGTFANVDDTISANNIAYITELGGNYTWHSMGSGVNGAVYAIEKYGSHIFAGGSFANAGSTVVNNVAHWNGISWASAGCLNGTVKDLVVFNGDLYACGNFGVCPDTNGGFAKWTGSSWQLIPGITGTINTMEVVDTVLMLGGDFTFGSNGKNVAKWNSNTGLQAFSNNIVSEVTDFENFEDTVYAICKANSFDDTLLLHQLAGSKWKATQIMGDTVQRQWTYMSSIDMMNPASFNTLCKHNDTLMIGGDFRKHLSTSSLRNSYCLTPRNAGYSYNYFHTDSPIHKMVVFKNSIIAGGSFKYGPGVSSYKIAELNGIGRRIMLTPPFNFIKSGSAIPACNGSVTGKITMDLDSNYGPYIMWALAPNNTYLDVDSIATGTYPVVVYSLYTSEQEIDTVVVPSVSIKALARVSSDSIVAEQDSVLYQWYNCVTNSPVPGENNRWFVPTVSGSYAALLKHPTLDRCKFFTRCYYVTAAGLSGGHRNFTANIFPNPANNFVQIRLDNSVDIIIEVKDASGKVLILEEKQDVHDTRIDIDKLSPGLYIISVSAATGETVHAKLIKE